MNTKEKLQKVLARAGVASRREIERWIADGRISVDGTVAHIGQTVDDTVNIRVDGRLIESSKLKPQSTRVLIYNKPEGEVSTRKDEKNRKTVFDNLPKLMRGRWINVGRLDINTQGLLLFTNNGDLANYLMHPAQELEREYAVRVLGQVDKSHIETMLAGVEIDGETMAFKKVGFSGGEGQNQWYHVVVTEGKNREVRKLWESQGLTVSRLIRVRYGDVTLPKWLMRGKWDEFKPLQVDKLLQSVKFSPRVSFGQNDVKKGRKSDSESRPQRNRKSNSKAVWKKRR